MAKKKAKNTEEEKQLCLRCRESEPTSEVLLKSEYAAGTLCKKCQLTMINLRLLDLSITPRFRKSTLANFDIPFRHPHRESIKVAAEVVREYAKNFHPHKAINLLLYGTVGTGKSHLAWGVLKYLAIHHDIIGKYRIFGDLMQDIRYGFGKKDSPQEKDLIEELCFTKLLVLDEVGSDNDTEYEMKMVQNILCNRYNNVLPTIVITNKNEDEFMKIFTERSLDRLLSEGNLRIPFAWLSYRTNKFRIEE